MAAGSSGSSEDLTRRLAEAEAHLRALRSGEVSTLAGEHGQLVVRLAESEARAAHIKQVLLAIRNVNQLIVAEDDPDRLIERACANLTETMGYHNAWIVLLDAPTGEVTATAASGLDVGLDQLAEQVRQGDCPRCVDRALAQDSVVVVQDPATNCRDCPLAGAYGGRAGLSCRLSHAGKTYGVLSVSVPAAYAEDQEEQELFSEVAGDLAFALHKIDAAWQLSESQRDLQRAQALAQVGSWRFDLNSHTVIASAETRRIYGLDESEWTIERVQTVPLPEYRATLDRALRDLIAGRGTYDVEFDIKRPADEVVRRIHSVAEYDARRNIVVGTIQDITERVRAEQAARKQHAMLARTETIAHVGSWEWDVATDQAQWSTELFRIFDLDPALGAPSLAAQEALFAADDYRRLREAVERCVREGTPYELEVRVQRADGQTRYCVARGQAEADDDGRVRRLVGSLQDIDERKRVEEAVRARERLLEAVVQTTADGYWQIDSQGRIVEVNQAYCEMSGYTRDQLVGMSIGDLDADELPAATAARIRRIIANGSELFEAKHRRQDGSVWPVEVSATWLGEEGGRFVCFCRDLSDRERRERRIALLAEMLDSAPASITVHNTERQFLFANRITATLHGYDDETEFKTINLHDLDVPETEALLRERMARIDEDGEACFEVEHYRKDGVAFPLEVLAKRIQWDGQPAILSIATDISARKTAEKALRESEERNRILSDVTIEGIVLHRNGVAIDVNRSLAAMLGFERSELLNRNLIDLVAPEDRPLVRENMAKAYAPPYVVRLARRDGSVFHAEVESRDISQADDVWRVSAIRDITERVRSEQELRRREAQLQRIFEILPVGLWFADKDGTLLRGNPMGVRIWGAEPHVALEDYGVFRAWRLPSREPLSADDWALAKTIREGITIVDEVLEIEAFDGRRKTILNSTAPVLDADGQVEGAIVVNVDISDRMLLEEQLRQAQKMESVGRLAGGVAHDFNNMLSVILGHVELMLESVPADDPARADLEEIRAAAGRSADLTRQLLAFARQQTVAPRLLDLNETVEGMLKMLRRLIGEDIDLAWLPGKSLGMVHIDPSQVDQILANLCVNARDAIGDTGRVTIETDTAVFDEARCFGHADWSPGHYVMLALHDTGCGMDPDTLSHLFEPFFTTKETGRGTGLGLSTVYGIVKQNDGFIDVDSRLGQGTTFRVYLPRHDGEPNPSAPPGDASRATGHETILLVEDEPSILKMTTRMLRRLGYVVLPAATPGEALQLAQAHADQVDLLMTDVVMPEMNGRDLATALMARHPRLKCIFMSGYTADVIAHHGVLEEDVHFVQKPFAMHSLVAQVRAVLDAESH